MLAAYIGNMDAAASGEAAVADVRAALDYIPTGESMKNVFLLVSLAIAGAPAFAKDKMIPLSEADAATLQGKKVALTVHERPTFVAMTAGKAGFGLLGVAAMASAGNKLVDDNHVQDPAGIVRTQLA